MRSFVHTAPEAVVITSPHGTVKSLNARAEALYGYSQSEIVGESAALLFEAGVQLPGTFARRFAAEQSCWRSLSENDTVRGRKKNGELFHVEVMLGDCVLDGAPVTIFYIRDASARVLQDQRLAELEREIAHLARHSVLGELATTITHELSQPLTAIINYTVAASRSAAAEPTPETLENNLALIAKAGEQAKRAWLILHRMRQLLQHRGAERVRDDLRLAIDDAVQLATIGAAERGIAVSIDLPPVPVMVLIDRVQVQVLVTNFIRNAIDELTGIEGEKAIWVRLAVGADGFAEISVEDTGHGISPEVFETLFDPFHTTKAEGLGVGLSLSRRIAQAHGGRLAARNRTPNGAIFSFKIPVV
ncbi:MULTISPECIES: ATP-binding protein [Rhodomicrobium]|uniref:sensor histidine kinase n=1 Tax=Rhodomicrobium TaxID=1068 RepID=UPI0014835F58|nr:MULTISPECIES: ATP-binding protein [Rhodomicrobium]